MCRFPTSAKEGLNVNDAVMYLIHEILNNDPQVQAKQKENAGICKSLIDERVS